MWESIYILVCSVCVSSKTTISLFTHGKYQKTRLWFIVIKEAGKWIIGGKKGSGPKVYSFLTLARWAAKRCRRCRERDYIYVYIPASTHTAAAHLANSSMAPLSQLFSQNGSSSVCVLVGKGHSIHLCCSVLYIYILSPSRWFSAPKSPAGSLSSRILYI